MERIALRVPVLVEGKYDKAAVSSAVDAPIVTTDGFRVFRDAEKRALIRRISGGGIVVLCDSDGAGGVIRSYVNGIVGRDLVYPVYVPRIKGKEKRKKEPSKEGVLGVEGVGTDVIREAFRALVSRNPQLLRGGGASPPRDPVTKADFYSDGLSGAPDASQRRDLLAERLGLPPGMTAGALLAAVNVITDRDGYREAVEKTEKNG
ncbi:MAG: DUF4093 domain-containing protein [Clostridia bacterium]|nr:DUF4093 domain-containing protein [Clostridia bacterium]